MMTEQVISQTALVGVSADCKIIEGRPYHTVGEKYLQAVIVGAQSVPLIIPALVENMPLSKLLDRLDGLLLTGSPSNVHPGLYDQQASQEHEPYDQARDELTLYLIRLALEKDIPLLAICRGMQELNVALGGSLHAALHELPNRLDHRHIESDNVDEWYGLQHTVQLSAKGQLAQLAGTDSLMVNSLHRQGIAELAEGLMVEGVAPDGTIEAVSVKGAKAFAFGVQWHPEYNVSGDDFSARLLVAFGAATRKHACQRNHTLML